MARVASTPAGRDGVYGWLLEREEQRVIECKDYVAWDGSVHRYPSWRLEALRVGRPVSVPSWVLPHGVQKGLPSAPSCPNSGQRTTVYADDTITVEAETLGRWAEDRGLDDQTYQGHARRYWRMTDLSWTEHEVGA